MRDVRWRMSEETPEKPEKEEAAAPEELPIILLGGDETGTPTDSVEVSHNKIYFYADITRPEILKLNKHLDSLEKKILTNSILLNSEPCDIYLHINSFGGSLFAGLAGVDYIKKCKIPILQKIKLFFALLLWRKIYQVNGVQYLLLIYNAYIMLVAYTVYKTFQLFINSFSRNT